MLEGVLGPGGTAAGGAGARLHARRQDRHGAEADPITGGYSKTDYVASFIGFAPARNPRLLVAVMVDEPQGGNSTAAWWPRRRSRRSSPSRCRT